jgi:hypothetical protein
MHAQNMAVPRPWEVEQASLAVTEVACAVIVAAVHTSDGRYR